MRFTPIQWISEYIKQLHVVVVYLKELPSFVRRLPAIVWHRIIWFVDPRRRKVKVLLARLEPIPGVTESMQKLRRDVYTACLLEIKDHELRLEIPLILAHTPKPSGAEQIFLMSIYPILIRRRLIAIPRPSPPGRLDLEIGYRGHADEYYFWEFEIDGSSKDRADRTPTPRTRLRDERVFLNYQIPAAGLIDEETMDPEETIIHIRSYFINILADLKKYGYQLLTAQPHTHEALIYNQRKQANSRVPSPLAKKRSRR